jgi:FSR family fosmidomycin resistance protein-like MFS transporter
MKERSLSVEVKINGVQLPPTNIPIRFVVLSPREMVDGSAHIEIDTSSADKDGSMTGFQEFIPNLQDVVKHLPGIGGIAGAVALMLVGVCVVGTFGVTMVLSHRYLPRHVGVASGLSVGLAMGIGGIAAVVLGAVADAVDLRVALTLCAAAPAIGVLYCLRLPAPARPQAKPKPVPVAAK